MKIRDQSLSALARKVNIGSGKAANVKTSKRGGTCINLDLDTGGKTLGIEYR